MLFATTVSSDQELIQILELQQENLKHNITEEEKDSQGFVTMRFTLDMLKAMHAIAPSIIVKDNDNVVAYAIVFMKEGRHLYPTLEPMFVNFEKLTWNNKEFNSYSYYVMGQICVSREYRGKNVFHLLYQKHRELYKDKFDFVVTEISTTNYRSLRAHERTGFKTIATHEDELDKWEVVIWDWV